MSKNEEEKPEKIVDRHTPKIFALSQPSLDRAELIITTTTRQSHVYTLTYTQVRLLAMQAEKARLSWPQEKKLKKTED